MCMLIKCNLFIVCDPLRLFTSLNIFIRITFFLTHGLEKETVNHLCCYNETNDNKSQIAVVKCRYEGFFRDGSVFAVGDGFPPDDFDGGFKFEDEDEDLSIDIKTIYRILDEKPDSAEGSQDNSSPAASSPDELKNSHLQNGTQMVDDWLPSRDSYNLTFDEPDLSPSPARTFSASLKDWFPVSQDGHPVAQSEMTSSVSSGSMDRYNTCFSDHAGNVSFHPVNCNVDTLSNHDDVITVSKLTSCSPTTFFEEVPGYGAAHNSSTMSGFCCESNSLSDGADNGLSSAQNCYNTSASSSEHAPNFAFQFFPNKEEAVNDADSGVSECQSDDATRVIFDRHGRVDSGSLDRKPVVDFSGARGIGFKCESNPSFSLPCGKPYNDFDSHLADGKAARVKVKPEAESEKVVYSSVRKEESIMDPVYAPGETSHWWSGASGCSVSYRTYIKEGFAFMAQQTSFPSQDSGNSNKFYDSNACLQYVAADPSPATQINGYLNSTIQQGHHEHIQARSSDYNFSNGSFESVQIVSSEYISDSDDDSDVCIIETNGQSANPYRPLAMKSPVVSSQYSSSPHTFNQPGGTRLQSNKENMIYQAALQVPDGLLLFGCVARLQLMTDLSLPNAEASLPDGVLAVRLMRHQRIALSWMANKETTGFPCSGGILADDQGLGKTISTIALILKERSTPSRACEESIKKQFFDLESEGGECASSKPNGRSEEVVGNCVGKVKGRPAAGTLVVCPTSVMRQWGDELRKKVTSEANLSVLVYHGSRRTKDPHELAKYDVVVTTYSIVSMEVPKQPLVDDEDEEKDDNSIDDLYSYFRFLKYDPYSSYVLFCNSIKNPVAKTLVKGYQKLQAILKTVMLRRTKGSLIDGKPIISLPPKSIELRKVEFTEEERDFYSNLEHTSRDQFQEYKEAGTVKQNYVKILLMLLRLHQACDHPLLVKGEYSFTWESSLGLAKKENLSEASLQICGICNDSPEDAVVSVCGHVFCKQCFYECLTGDNNLCPNINCNSRLATVPSMHDSASSVVHVETVDPCSEGLPYESSKIKAALEILQSLARPQDSTYMNQISQKSGDSNLSVIPVKVTVMIMSLKAASLGLNMVAACHVLMLDLWWNPTTEDQAIDRAHRIGQTRPVTVQKKRMMVASAFGEDEKGSRQSHLTVEDLNYLFMAD
ncbi:hypothetical protein IGI04_040113 [Brassica rapa subsp. trilocularis]|uniref:RING-type domain-containing protein n=1 Tax=Brassica rapa subsp. trilocularis TaxID=1813537 RepID=A0ABQ7KLV8_BRACM|nr:hypothetical protein IGI04_040113 [Brassica rapa subsp. trilocularis]